MNDFLTWQTLATFAGCSAAVAVLTQFIKNAGGLKKVPTQWVSYGLAVILMLSATYFTGALTGPVAALIPFNAVVVSLAANGAYAAIQRVSGSDTATIVPDGTTVKVIDKDGYTLGTISSDGVKAADSKVDAEPAKSAEIAAQPSETAPDADKDKVVIG
jgi:hypothetical protein